MNEPSRVVPWRGVRVLLLAGCGAVLLPAVAVGQVPPDTSAPPSGAAGARAAVAVVGYRTVEAATLGGTFVAVPIVTVGSGTLVAEGVAVTAQAHVQGATFLAVTGPEGTGFLPAVAARMEGDVVVLVVGGSVSSGFELPSGTSAPVASVGQAVTVFAGPRAGESAPREIAATVSRGMVYGMIELSVPDAGALVGAPVFDADGKLVGVLVKPHAEDPNLGYAWPASAVAAAVDLARSDGTLDAARAVLSSGTPLPPAAAPLFDPRWIRSAPPAAGAPTDELATALCESTVAGDMARVADQAREAAEADSTGVVALLQAALAWNVAFCDLRKLGLDPGFLLRRETVGAWLARGNATLDRVAAAAADMRRLRDAGAATIAASPLGNLLLRFDEELQWRVSEARAGLPTPPPPEPYIPQPPPPIPVGPAPLPPVGPPPVGPPLPEVPVEVDDPQASRIFVAPTAINPPAGTVNVRTIDIGAWYLEYAITDNIRFDLAAIVPVLNFALMPGVRFGGEVAEDVWVGIHANLGFWLLYTPGESQQVEVMALFYGGGPALTFGSPNAFFNISLQAYGVTVFNKEQTWSSGETTEGWDTSTFGAFLPSLGGSVRVSQIVKLNAELYAPGFTGSGDIPYGEVWILVYGLRLFGSTIYGDIAFVMPFFEDMLDIIQFCPFGFPMLGLGWQW